MLYSFVKVCVDADVNVFVDGGRNKKAAKLFVIRRQIGSSPADRNTKWGTHDNHGAAVVRFSTKVSWVITPILWRFCRSKSAGVREPNPACSKAR